MSKSIIKKKLSNTKKINDEKWHSLDENVVFQELLSGKVGLDPKEAADRLEIYGLNTLPSKDLPGIWKILFHQIKDPLIYILIAAAIASLAIGEMTDAFFIIAVVSLNSALGAYQEYNAEKSAASLESLLRIKARVRRASKEFELPSEELVPGDIVLLKSGDKVPADLRLLEAKNLSSDESFLTGESIAATKIAGLLPENIGVSERSNIVFAGATITTGRGIGIVVNTGIQTEVGQIAEEVNESESAKPPLITRMEKFTKQISVVILFISALLAVLLRLEGFDLATIFFFVVALGVAAIPEGLPVALTVALSIAVSRMTKRNVIVRKLAAVESLGSCTVIASDKTGTLTVNQQTARVVFLANGQGFNISGQGYNGEGNVSPMNQGEVSDQERNRLREFSVLAMLANEGSLIREKGEWVHHGDAMDVAFLAMGYKLGITSEEAESEVHPLDMIPYESERKFSAAFYQKNGTTFIAAKGAVERMLEFCDRILDEDKILDIDRVKIENRAEELAAQGYRVLAVAGTQYPEFKKKDSYKDEELPKMVFQGLVGFIDPLRSEVANAVNKCKDAGIKVIMITGDHPKTAQAIAREVGISEHDASVVTGQKLTEAGPSDGPEFKKLVGSSRVFARVSPIQKLEIVEVLINQGEFVAVTGDGVNDAPALRRANIGVAMGSGTDVAKEISGMIVTDDHFASIVSGVEEGRFAYDNVRKVIYLLISTGTGVVMFSIISILVGLPLPLLPVQLLWLNLVTSGIQDIGLAFEKGEPGAMKRKPRKTNEKIFNTQMISQTLVSGLTMGTIALGFWYYLIEVQGMNESYARNIIFLLMVLMQNVHVFDCRSEFVSAFKIPISRNYFLIIGVLIAQGIHILSMQLPFMQEILQIGPIPFVEWFQVFILALLILVVMEIYKQINKRMLLKQNMNDDDNG